MRVTSSLAALALLLWGAAAASAQADDAAILRAFEGGYARAIEKAAAVTVSIKVDRQPEKQPRPASPTGIFGGVFALRPDAPVSGLIVEPDGWIATSYFNIQGEVNGIEVTLPDGAIQTAKLVGWNVGADLALLKVEATGLPTLKSSDPADLRTGDIVLAVGRAPDGRGVTANPGIISAAGRHRGRAVQVDSRLNYGNVGGPLVDLEGHFVGMTSKVSTASADNRGQNSGVGFVLLSSKVAELLPDLKKGAQVRGGEGRPYLGIMGDVNYDAGDGAKVTSTVPGASAERAGVQPGDIIQAVDGAKILNFNDLRGEISKRKIGDTVKVKIRRGADQLEIPVPLGENPGE